jgi:phosphoenolpyruvate-protein phosphotransferase (PTS system enzyme I)
MVSAKIDIPQDSFLVGIGSSPGIAIGEAYLVNRARIAAIDRKILPEQVDAEIAAFRDALARSRRQLQDVRREAEDPQLSEHLYIIDTHLLILDDQMLVENTIRTIREELVNAEGALKTTLNRFRAVFDKIEDEYLRERRSDIDSIGDRLLRNLKGEGQQSLRDIDHKVVVVAHDLSPADTMQMDRDKIIGFVTDVGGRTSHTSILGRSLGIPAVVGLESATALIPPGVPMIVDGSAGTIVLNPSPETFREYLLKKQAYEYHEQELLSYCELPAATRDGERVVLRCNIESAAEIPQALHHGAEGVGLFRTEFLFMNRPAPPGEEEQCQIYRELAVRMAPHPVTIRTLDVGGDKFVPEVNLSDESNPAMGLRAVRFSLKERRLFRVQLRAILRAGVHGNLRVMFPMISGVAEVRHCKECLAEARAELLAEGIPCAGNLPIGVMIETPAAAIIAPLLAAQVDFFSVGTNDLIQYCLAVDRSNEHVAYLYEPLHPAVLRALQMTCQAARSAGIEVGMCGEMAGEPLYILILLALGFHELSMNSIGIPRLKQIIREIRRADGVTLLEELLQLPTAAEVAAHLEAYMARHFPTIFGTPTI